MGRNRNRPPKRVRNRRERRSSAATLAMAAAVGRVPAGRSSSGRRGSRAKDSPGRILFELGGVDEDLAREAMIRGMHKLPIKTKFVVREEH